MIGTKRKTDDDRLPEHRVLTLIQAMPRCLRPAADLRGAILEALSCYRFERVDRFLPSQAEGRRHAERVAKTASKLMALLEDRKSIWLLGDDPEPGFRLKSELPAKLRELEEIADHAVESPELENEDAMTGLLRTLVGIYEWATGELAKLPWTDRITGEIRGPLLDFLVIAAADAFTEEPMTSDAIRHRLRPFMRTGDQERKIHCHCPVRSAQEAVKANATTPKQQVAAYDETIEAKCRPDRPAIGHDRGDA